MVFHESLQFLPVSLKQLVALLVKVGRGYFQNLYDVVTNMYPDAQVLLLNSKETFCKDYLDSLARLDKSILTLHKALFNQLAGVEYSQEDYAYA